MSEEERAAALALLASSHEASIATAEEGKPYASATGFLYEKGAADGGLGRLYLLLSDLARHTRNIARSPEVSLLVVEENRALPIHERERLTVQATARRVEDAGKCRQLEALYLKAFPRAEVFFTLPDFRFYELAPSEIHWIGGFGKAATLR